MAEGKYDHAITFYRTAQAIYYRLELDELEGNLAEADGISVYGSNLL